MRTPDEAGRHGDGDEHAHHRDDEDKQPALPAAEAVVGLISSCHITRRRRRATNARPPKPIVNIAPKMAESGACSELVAGPT